MLIEKNKETPSWLSDEDYNTAVSLYKENNLEGVKFLTNIARPYQEGPLKWSYDFLQKQMFTVYKKM